jgi:glucose-6-phosphate 1-dehydrogenase
LSVFDADELQDFIKEVSDTFRLTDTCNQAWDLIDAIIHEWHESAIAINSPELAAAFNDETEEISLTPPINKSGL